MPDNATSSCARSYWRARWASSAGQRARARGISSEAVSHSGQGCAITSRLVVPRARYDDVILQTQSSVTSLLNTDPSDPSLSKTRTILRAMFIEYGRAIRADKHHHDPGKYIYRAYGLANFTHDVLAQAKPALAERGCDVSPLL